MRIHEWMTREGAMSQPMDSCNFLQRHLCMVSCAFFLTVCFLLGGQPFGAFFPSLSVCDFGAGEEDRVRASRLLESWRKLQASPAVHIPFYFPRKNSLPFLSTLTDFPLLLLSSVPESSVSGLNYQPTSSEIYSSWISISGCSTACPSGEYRGQTAPNLS